MGAGVGEAELRAIRDRAKEAMMVGGCMIWFSCQEGEIEGLDGRRLWIMDSVDMRGVGWLSCSQSNYGGMLRMLGMLVGVLLC